MASPDEIIEFWFPPEQARADALWWGKDPALDAEIERRFGPTLARASQGELDDWAASARGRLALVVVLDQFSRNIYRGDAKTYAQDARARALAHEGLSRGHDRELTPHQRLFLYMPLEHSEALDDQQRCVELVEALAADVAAEPGVSEDRRKRFANYIDYAIAHRDIVARFGRFPHRNEILGRESTAEEREFLTKPGSSF